MAFDRLQPHLDTILAARQDGKTLAQVQELLSEQYGISTTPGTLSKFLKATAPDNAPRAMSDEEEKRFEIIALLTEILSETSGKAEEHRVVIEHLAGKVAVTGAQVEELEKSLLEKLSSSGQNNVGVSTTILTRIWTRAFLITGLFWAIVFVATRFI